MLYMKYIIISSEIKLGALSPMQHLCSYRVKKVAYTQSFWGERTVQSMAEQGPSLFVAQQLFLSTV